MTAAHQHSLTLHLPDTTYAALRRRADASQRSMESEGVSLLQTALVTPAVCVRPSTECNVTVWLADADGKPLAALCRTCGRLSDIRDNPIGNGALH